MFRRSTASSRFVATAVFAALAPLSAYFVVDVLAVGVTDAVVGGLAAGLFVAAAAFVYASGVSLPVYVPTVVFVAVGVVLVREFLRYGPAGIQSVITPAFAVAVVFTLLLGGSVGFGARRVTDRPATSTHLE